MEKIKKILPLIVIVLPLFFCSCSKQKVAGVSEIPKSAAGGLMVLAPEDLPEKAATETGEISCPFGFVFDQGAGACLNEGEILTAEAKRAVSSAVEGCGMKMPGLVITEISAAGCAGCFMVNLQKEDKGVKVILDNWQIENVSSFRPAGKNQEIPKDPEGFVRYAAAEIMEMEPDFISPKPVSVKWDTPEGKSEFLGKGIIYDEGYGSRRVFDMQTTVLEKLPLIGFETDSLNRIDEAGISFTGLKKGSMVCNVIFSDGSLELRCADAHGI